MRYSSYKIDLFFFAQLHRRYFWNFLDTQYKFHKCHHWVSPILGLVISIFAVFFFPETGSEFVRSWNFEHYGVHSNSIRISNPNEHLNNNEIDVSLWNCKFPEKLQCKNHPFLLINIKKNYIESIFQTVLTLQGDIGNGWP